MTAMWVEQSERGAQAGNGLVRVGFQRVAGAVVVSAIGLEGGPNLAAPRAGDSLWEIEFGAAGGERVKVTSADAPAAPMHAACEEVATIALRWPQIHVGAGTAEVEVRVTIRPGDPVTYWDLRVAAAPEAPALWSITFPIVSAGAEARLSLAFPTGWGLRFDDALGAGEVRGTYPSAMTAMQFMACWQEGGGLYVGAHDPAANHKQFIATPLADQERLRLAVVNYPAGMGSITRWDLPYQAAVGAFDGDWYDAARLHRRWAVGGAPWMGGGELRQRAGTPEWLKDIVIWCVGGGSPAEAVEPARRFAAYFGVPAALHWYNWHVIPFDDHYPEYFPAKDGFAHGVAELQQAGVRVMPYINGRLWDPRTDSWAAENAEAACAKDERGARYEETYGSGVPLVVMCPHTEQWQAKVVSLVERLVGECGVDGVYVDQVSAAPAKLCFDAAHGHEVGGGGFWVAAYRRMLERARALLPAGRMLTTEESADPWIDLLDALLLVNTPPQRGQVIPLFPAVYAGRTITFGFQYIAGDDLDRGLPFRAKMARAFTWGAQLGWVGPQVLDERYAREAEYLRALARCRQRAHEFLAYGEMLPPLRLRGVPEVTIEGKAPFGGDYRIEMPAVIGSAWRAPGGEVGVALTNMTDEEQVARLDLADPRLGLAPGPRRVTRITAEGEEPAGELGSPACEETLPPRSAVVLRFAAANAPAR